MKLMSGPAGRDPFRRCGDKLNQISPGVSSLHRNHSILITLNGGLPNGTHFSLCDTARFREPRLLGIHILADNSRPYGSP